MDGFTFSSRRGTSHKVIGRCALNYGLNPALSGSEWDRRFRDCDYRPNSNRYYKRDRDRSRKRCWNVTISGDGTLLHLPPACRAQNVADDAGPRPRREGGGLNFDTHLMFGFTDEFQSAGIESDRIWLEKRKVGRLTLVVSDSGRSTAAQRTAAPLNIVRWHDETFAFTDAQELIANDRVSGRAGRRTRAQSTGETKHDVTFHSVYNYDFGGFANSARARIRGTWRADTEKKRQAARGKRWSVLEWDGRWPMGWSADGAVFNSVGLETNGTGFNLDHCALIDELMTYVKPITRLPEYTLSLLSQFLEAPTALLEVVKPLEQVRATFPLRVPRAEPRRPGLSRPSLCEKRPDRLFNVRPLFL
ncbi:hypothetical protein EVAR_41514_1 [Eumeta japonica]|uniref:Uncharacterized protein n=1 Tax=Eumeta variegata TaxID=151549 RepID=A0A4C1X6I6_EUMVA|nr:hypothetical protein EVAR_41514_1 [Eumeta japonica]